MKSAFEKYLKDQGYSVETPAGNQSTVYDYIKRVEKVCEWEDITMQELADDIEVIVAKYDVGGEKANLGEKSHRAVINALKRFKEFTS